MNTYSTFGRGHSVADPFFDRPDHSDAIQSRAEEISMQFINNESDDYKDEIVETYAEAAGTFLSALGLSERDHSILCDYVQDDPNLVCPPNDGYDDFRAVCIAWNKGLVAASLAAALVEAESEFNG